MKPILTLILLLTHSAFAQLQWTETEKLYTLTKDSPSKYESLFHYHNTGSKPIEIKKVQYSCNCMGSAKAFKPITIPPNEKGSLPVKFSLKGRDKDFTRVIRVYLDDKKEAQLLKVKVTVPKKIVKEFNEPVKKVFEKTWNINELKVQTSCPFQGTEILKDLYVDYQDRRIFTCCEECLPLVKANPKLAISMLKTMGQYPPLIKDLKK